MEHIRLLVTHLLGVEQPRQTSVGLKVPYPDPKDKDEVMANLRYVEAEIQFCEDSIRHDYPDISHRHNAKFLLKCVGIAQQVVAGQADTEHALAISKAAVAILRRINPYAERYYAVKRGAPDILKNLDSLGTLGDEYMRGFARLGRTILEADPNPPPLDSRRTFKESYDAFFFSPSTSANV